MNEYPLIYLDFVELITGEQILKKLKEHEFPPTFHIKLNPDSPDMLILKSKLDERFIPIISMLFDRLGEID